MRRLYGARDSKRGLARSFAWFTSVSRMPPRLCSAWSCSPASPPSATTSTSTGCSPATSNTSVSSKASPELLNPDQHEVVTARLEHGRAAGGDVYRLRGLHPHRAVNHLGSVQLDGLGDIAPRPKQSVNRPATVVDRQIHGRVGTSRLWSVCVGDLQLTGALRAWGTGGEDHQQQETRDPTLRGRETESFRRHDHLTVSSLTMPSSKWLSSVPSSSSSTMSPPSGVPCQAVRPDLVRPGARRSGRY